MKIIIPWSGGLDSSALVYKRLAEGHEVISFTFVNIATEPVADALIASGSKTE